MKSWILYLVLALAGSTTIAQEPAQYYARTYTTDNGLPSNGIKGLQWDEATGFLWIATEAGICRFNGFDFRIYSKDNTPFIGSERMQFIVRNNAGKIYAVDQSGIIMTVSGNSLLFSEKLRAPAPGSFDKLFAIGVSDTLFHSKKDLKDKHPFTLLFNPVLPVNDTSCYIIFDNQIFYYSASHHVAQRYPDTTVRGLYGFKLGREIFYIDEEMQIHDLNENPSHNQQIPVVNDDNVPFVHLDRNARVYWSTGMKNPIIIKGKNAWTLSRFGNKIKASLIWSDIPTREVIDYVQYSPEKNLLFLGTQSKGIIIMNRNRVDAMKYKNANAGEQTAYYSQVRLPDGNVLTGEGHVIGRHTSASPNSLPIEGKFGNLVSSSGDSVIWYSKGSSVAGTHLLYSYNVLSGRTTEYPKIRTAENIVRRLLSGRRFISTEYGIGFLDNDSISYLYRHPQITYSTMIFDFTEVTPGILFIASCAGILQFDISHRKMDTLLQSEGNCIRSIWKYNDYYFFGSYGKGFYIWKNGVLKSMPTDKRKYLLYAHCFIPDSKGFCWISTNRGLFKVKISDLINAYDNNVKDIYYHYFGKADGMQMVEMNGGCNPCAVETVNKILSFPTMDGLLWVDPVRAGPILPDGKLFIDEIIADNVTIDKIGDGTIQLSPSTRNVSFSLAYSAWCNNENIYIDYQVNDSTVWRPVNTDNASVVTLNNLSPGNYNIRFRKLNGFGVNNYTYKIIQFQIITPWYMKWWFRLLGLIVFALLIYMYVHLRTNRLKKRQLQLEKLVAGKTRELQQKNEVLEKNDTIKTRLISIISHDIITPLKFLTVAGKNLLEKKELMSDALQKETISEITTTSQELQLLSTNILNWIKYQNENRRLQKESFNVHEMVNQVIGVLGSFANQKKVGLINDTDRDLIINQYFEPLKIIIYNLISNAINFTDRGNVIISNYFGDNDEFIITVQDEGSGMTAEQIQNIMADQYIISSSKKDNRKGNGLGYLIIRDLLKMMGASYSIKSEKGNGTSVNVVIRLDKS